MPTGTGDSVRPSSVTYKSIVAYDGTEFEGFQRQAQGIRTIQACLEEALNRLGWLDRSILAAGRTDRGVHAEGQVISYRLDWGHTTEDLSRALNACLPWDIAVRQTEIAPADFHPRFSASSRRYRYAFFVDRYRQPLRERYAMRLSQPPNLDLMREAASSLVGERDYRVFGPAPIPEGTTRRVILDAALSAGRDGFSFEIEANAFLQHMVRRIAGALVAVGRGKLALDEFQGLLNEEHARWEGALAPPCGLCLLQVRYPGYPA